MMLVTEKQVWPFAGATMGVITRIRRFLGCDELARDNLESFVRQFGCTDLPRRSPGDAGSIAIIVPCYRHARYLEKTFSSIVNQTRKPDQVVFVNDCSPDRTGWILKDLVRNCNNTGGTNFRIITNMTNMGQSRSLNRAINEVGTDLVMVLNDDDYLMHDAVEVVMDLFLNNGDIFLIGSHSIHFSSDEDLAAGAKMIRGLASDTDIPLVRHYPADIAGYRKSIDLNMTHSASCFLKSAWQTVGGYCPDRRKRIVLSSDRDFQLRLNALFPVAVSYEVPFVYWRSNSSVDGGIFS